MKLYDGRDWVDGTQGDFLYVPPGRHPRLPQRGRRAHLHPDAVRPPDAPREHYFEGIARLSEMTDDARRESFNANDNYFVD
jgi:hypothetical protein